VRNEHALKGKRRRRLHQHSTNRTVATLCTTTTITSVIDFFHFETASDFLGQPEHACFRAVQAAFFNGIMFRNAAIILRVLDESAQYLFYRTRSFHASWCFESIGQPSLYPHAESSAIWPRLYHVPAG